MTSLRVNKEEWSIQGRVSLPLIVDKQRNGLSARQRQEVVNTRRPSHDKKGPLCSLLLLRCMHLKLNDLEIQKEQKEPSCNFEQTFAQQISPKVRVGSLWWDGRFDCSGGGSCRCHLSRAGRPPTSGLWRCVMSKFVTLRQPLYILFVIHVCRATKQVHQRGSRMAAAVVRGQARDGDAWLPLDGGDRVRVVQGVPRGCSRPQGLLTFLY